MSVHATPSAATNAPAATRRRSPAPRRFEGRLQPDPESFGSGSDRVLQTVQRLLDAGATVFADQGFHESSVEEILQEANLGRGTFYRYFEDKSALLATLSEDGAVRLEMMVENLGAALVGDDRGEALRGWLRESLGFHRRYRGVFRAWTGQDSDDPSLAEFGVRVAESILLSFDDALAQIDRDYPFDVRVGSLVLLSMFERVPDYAFGTEYAMSDDRIVEVLAGLAERGLLCEQRPRPARRASASKR
jgi:AcrR family transcriptional regulator